MGATTFSTTSGVIMLSVIYASVTNKPFKLSVIMLNVVKLIVFVMNVVMLSVFMLNVVAPA